MILIIVTICLFVAYYLSSFNTLNTGHKYFFILLYLIFAVINRLLISPELNKDYYGYFDLHNFDDPEDFVSFLFSEPYLYLIYKFFNLFISDKLIIFNFIYWLNFSITNIYFVWLLTRYDISVWKKVTLFAFYYYLFGFVLLRNAPVYMLFSCFFYYSFRDKKFYNILLTPFMHLSALSLIITVFNKNKYYFKVLFFILLILLPVLLIYILPLLNSLIALQNSMNKIDSYSGEMLSVSIFHKIYFAFVSFALAITFFVYQKKAMNPILVTTAIFYYTSFFINPVLGFRFSPYVFMAILLFNFKDEFSPKLIKFIDFASFLLLPYFIFTLVDTHHL
jgi:hypothetical protein